MIITTSIGREMFRFMCIFMAQLLFFFVIIYFDAIFMAMCRGMNSTLTTLFLVYVFLSNVNEKWKIETFLCYPCNWKQKRNSLFLFAKIACKNNARYVFTNHMTMANPKFKFKFDYTIAVTEWMFKNMFFSDVALFRIILANILRII